MATIRKQIYPGKNIKRKCKIPFLNVHRVFDTQRHCDTQHKSSTSPRFKTPEFLPGA